MFRSWISVHAGRKGQGFETRTAFADERGGAQDEVIEIVEVLAGIISPIRGTWSVTLGFRLVIRDLVVAVDEVRVEIRE